MLLQCDIPLVKILIFFLFSLCFICPKTALSQGVGFITTPDNLTVLEGERPLFFCSTNVTDVTISWFVNDQKVTFRKPNLAVLSEDGKSSLRFLLVRKKDQSSVVCKVSRNPSNQDDFLLSSSPVYLNVIQRNAVPNGYPKIIEFPPAPRVFELGTRAFLMWKIESSTKLSVNYIKDSLPFDVSGSRIIVSNTGENMFGFQISDATESDSGKYECVATNGLGSDFSEQVTVFVKRRMVPPYFSRLPKNEELTQGGSINVTCVAVGSPMPVVKWFNGSQELTCGQQTEGRCVLELKNVQVSSNISCVATSDLGEIASNVQIIVRVLPDAPEDIQCFNITSTSAVVTWTLKRESEKNRENPSFLVSYKRAGNDDAAEINTSEKQVALSSLMPFSEYQVSVRLQTDSVTSSPVSMKFVTKEDAPYDPPQKIRASANSFNSIFVYWEEPTLANGHIKGYKIYFSNDFDVPMTAWSMSVVRDRSTLLRDLQPDRLYKISVLAFNSIGEGPKSDPISVLMKKNANPEPPQNLQVSSKTSTTVTLKWQHAITSDVTSYIVNYKIVRSGSGESSASFITSGGNNFTVTISSSENSLTIKDLSPFMVYHFKMAAKSEKAMSSFTKIVEVETLEEVPSQSPGNVQADAPDSRTIRLTWSPISFEKRNGKILGYRVLHTHLDISRNEGEGDVRKIETGVTINVPYPEHFLMLRNLPVWSKHKLKVTGYTSMGDGPWSSSVVVQTLEDIPGEPKKLKVVVQSSTSVMVMWRPPSEPNGVIRGYQVLYLELDKYEEIVGNQKVFDVTNGSVTEALVTGLLPATFYDFQVAAYTRRGDGARCKTKRIKTMTPFIGEPQSFRLFQQQVNPSIVLATWEAPLQSSNTRSSSIQGYKLSYQAKDSIDDNMEEVIIDGDVTQAQSKALLSGVEYEFQIMAKSMGEFGPPAFASIAIPEGSPSESPSNVSTERLKSNTAHLVWTPLSYDKWNGKPAGYKVKMRETGTTEELLEITSATEVTFNGLKANTAYVVQVAACTKTGCGPWSDIVELDASPSPVFGRPARTFSLPTPIAERISSATAMVRLNRTLLEMPHGKYYLAVVQEAAAKSQSPVDFSSTQLLSSSENSMAWFCGQFLSVHFPLEFLVGDGMSDQLFTNKKLNLDNFAYRFFVRFVSENGSETSSEYSQAIGASIVDSTNVGHLAEGGVGVGSSDQLLVFIGPVILALVLVVVIILVIVCIRKRNLKSKKDKHYRNQNKLVKDACEIPLNSQYPIDSDCHRYHSTGFLNAHEIIPIHQLAFRIEELKKNDRELLRKEYESIDSEKQFTWTASNLEENRHKNRYANVVAYDHSRVPLQSHGYPGSDYINANFIDGNHCKNVYIATQGPMPETFAHFWRMIWEHKCSTIIMITKLEERNRIKCDQYWPDKGSEVYEGIQVAVKDVLQLTSYTVRTFSISVRDFMETREVLQLQFTAWPDHGVPEYPTLLLQFIRRVKTANHFHGGPIVVHCSAGVGRTGALIAIDLCLDQVAQTGRVDVLGCVTKLRSQRNYMVQSDDQYQFIYEAVLEAVESPGETEVPADNLCAHIQDLKNIDPKTGFLKLTYEYQKLSVIHYDSSQFQIANLTCNKSKNRNPGVLPLDSTRVCLQPIRGVDGSDYINASFVDGYRFQQSYIATQAPMIDTTNDFWRMIWENNCIIIVMLTNLNESGIERCHQYWPVDRSMRYQYFVLDPASSINFGQYLIREFRMTDARDGQSRIIYQFHFIDWSQTGGNFLANGQQFINFIGQVENTRSKIDNCGPIAIHCGSGSGRTGVFVALSYVLERMRTEGVIDLFETAKILRTQRPFMIQTEEQYGFCYQAASEYLSSFDHYTK